MRYLEDLTATINSQNTETTKKEEGIWIYLAWLQRGLPTGFLK
jgi:hypothetical protein